MDMSKVVVPVSLNQAQGQHVPEWERFWNHSENMEYLTPVPPIHQ